jgi:hypothetical protein
MEILRLPETTSIDVSFNVAQASATYIISYQDLNTYDRFSASATSDSAGVVTFTLDPRYLNYTATLDVDVMTSASSIVMSDGIDIVKPYCDISSLANKLGITTAQTIQSEKVARKIIESEAGKFGLVRKQKEIYGMGMDYLPIDEPIQKLYYLYENGELIYDYEDLNVQDYKISVDRTSIVTATERVNKMEYQRVWRDRYLDTDFTSGFDYIVDADFGYKVVPEDVQEACELLIQDIASNSLRYVNRYITEFDNNEFKIKFSDGFQSGTGNMIADKILSRYKNRIIPGVI